ncbi:MAG TPA: hypothetical protein VG409_05450, partial [Actinomycetota bacterium]|nr:hypothetical protein [Actinomycetota bacterium]
MPAAPFGVARRPGAAARPHLGRYYPATEPPQPASRRTTAVPTSDPRPQRPGRDPGARVAYLPPRAAKA